MHFVFCCKSFKGFVFGYRVAILTKISFHTCGQRSSLLNCLPLLHRMIPPRISRPRLFFIQHDQKTHDQPNAASTAPHAAPRHPTSPHPTRNREIDLLSDNFSVLGLYMETYTSRLGHLLRKLVLRSIRKATKLTFRVCRYF